MKTILALVLLFGLVGCARIEPEVRSDGTLQDTMALVPELDGCKIYSIRNKDLTLVYIVRCPNSTTSAHWQDGKTYKESVTISQDEFDAKKAELIAKQNAMMTAIEEASKKAEAVHKKIKADALRKLTDDEKIALGLK
jgi:hypothetical protein